MHNEIDLLQRQIEDLKAENLRLRQNENETVYRSLFEKNHAVMLLIDPETAAIKDANPAACAYYGWSQEELTKLRIDEINTLNKDEVFAQMQLARAEKRRNFFFKHRRADGTIRDVEVYSGPLTVRGQTLLYSIVHDITERRQAEEAQRQSEEKFRLAFHTSPDSINFNRLSDGVYIDINEGFTKLAGYTREDAVGKSSIDLNIWYDPKDRQRLVKALQSEGYVENLEARFMRKNGQIGVGLMSARVLRLHQEDVILSITRDITERKQVEDALRESEDKYSQLVESLTDAILVWSSEDIVYANPAALKLFRANQAGDLIGKRYLDFVHPDDRSESVERIKKSKNEKWIAPRREHRMITMNGQVLHVESTGVPIQCQGQIQHFGIFSDITERKQAEDALRESEAIFSSFMEHCPVYVFFKDGTSRSIRLSRNYEQMLGKPIEDLLGKTMDELFPSDLAKEMIGDDLSVIRNGKPIKVVEELSGRTFETTKFPVLQPGKPPFLAGFTIDITERKRADQQREKLEAQLRQAQKMEAIGTLAGGIAHDFNNILSVIIGNAELLKMTDISFSDRGEVHHILSAAKRAKDLVRQILAFSRQGEQQKLLMSLKPVVKETVEFLRASIPSTIQLQHYIKPDTGAIMADPTQMQQVLMNLCTNAGHAMEKEGGVLKIELDTLEIGEADGKVDPEVENGEYVRVIISDTGHGIEPGILPRIFDPYFTTKGPEKGTGLGLSVVHGIVKSHGGIIKVYSEVGKGTVFHVLLPRADEAPKKEEKAVRLLPSGTERILVVDDEKPLVDIYQHMLGMLGYQVETRTSPVEALEAVRMNPQKYDLVITDMTMPQMTGYGFSKKLLEIRPGLPVILCTGFSDQVNEEKARSAGILAFLLKPVPLHDLANTMRKVLDETHREKHS